MANNPSTNDLEVYPTSDLIAEVMRRCSPAVFIGTKYEGETGDREWKNFTNWKGNLETCRGMVKEVDAFLERVMVRNEIERALGKKD